MSKMIATRDAYGQTLPLLKNIIVMDADLSKATKTDIFAAHDPEKFFNTGISEQAMVGIAAGLATEDQPVFVSSFAIFLASRANEIIRNSVCYQRKNVKLVATHAGISVGYDGGSHQSVEDIGLLKSIPNLIIISPLDPSQTTQVIEFIAKDPNPTYVRLGRTPVADFSSDQQFEIGKVYPLNNINSKHAVIGHGLILNYAAQTMLDGVKIINCPTIKPINVDSLMDSLAGVEYLLVCEEHNIYGGLYETITALLCNTEIKVYPLAINDQFGESGHPDDVLSKHNLDLNSVQSEINNFLEIE